MRIILQRGSESPPTLRDEWDLLLKFLKEFYCTNNQ